MDGLLVSRRLVILGSGAACLVLAGCTSTSVLETIGPGSVADATEASLPLVNAIRARSSQPPLAADPVAANAARDQAIRMAQHGRMAHDLGSDRNFLARMKRLEVRLPAAENIATGQSDAAGAIAAWQHSKKHLVNMVGPYRGLGVAVARNGEDRPFWAMVLSNPDRLFDRFG